MELTWEHGQRIYEPAFYMYQKDSYHLKVNQYDYRHSQDTFGKKYETLKYPQPLNEMLAVSDFPGYKLIFHQ